MARRERGSLKLLCGALSVGSLCRRKESTGNKNLEVVNLENKLTQQDDVTSPEIILERKVTTPLTDLSEDSQSEVSSKTQCTKSVSQYSNISRDLFSDRGSEDEEVEAPVEDAASLQNENSSLASQSENSSIRPRTISKDYLTDEVGDSELSNCEISGSEDCDDSSVTSDEQSITSPCASRQEVVIEGDECVSIPEATNALHSSDVSYALPSETPTVEASEVTHCETSIAQDENDSSVLSDEGSEVSENGPSVLSDEGSEVSPGSCGEEINAAVKENMLSPSENDLEHSESSSSLKSQNSVNVVNLESPVKLTSESPKIEDEAESKVSGETRRNKKIKKRERKLTQAWDLIWYCHEISLTGKYTGSAVMGDKGLVAHGHGKLCFFNGDTYVGPFKDGDMHGKHAVYKTRKGGQYYGAYEHNKKHGFGEFVHDDGTSYIGRYDKGHADGFGVQYNFDGSVFHRGKWTAGIPVRGGTHENDVPKRSAKLASDITGGVSNDTTCRSVSHPEDRASITKSVEPDQPQVINPPVETRVSKNIAPYQTTMLSMESIEVAPGRSNLPSEAVISFSSSEDDSEGYQPKVMNPPVETRVHQSIAPYHTTKASMETIAEIPGKMNSSTIPFAKNLPPEAGISLSSSDDDSVGVSIYDPNYTDVLRKRQATRTYNFSPLLPLKESLDAVTENVFESGSERE